MRCAYRKLYEYQSAFPPCSSFIPFIPLSVIAFFQLIFSPHSIIPPGISFFSSPRFRYSWDEDDTEGGGPEGVPDFQDVCGQSHWSDLRSGQWDASGEGGRGFSFPSSPPITAFLTVQITHNRLLDSFWSFLSGGHNDLASSSLVKVMAAKIKKWFTANNISHLGGNNVVWIGIWAGFNRARFLNNAPGLECSTLYSVLKCALSHILTTNILMSLHPLSLSGTLRSCCQSVRRSPEQIHGCSLWWDFHGENGNYKKKKRKEEHRFPATLMNKLKPVTYIMLVQTIN